MHMPYIFRAYPMHIPCRSHTHSIHIPCLFHAFMLVACAFHEIPRDPTRFHEISRCCVQAWRVYSPTPHCALFWDLWGGHLRHYLGSPRRGSRGHAEGPPNRGLICNTYCGFFPRHLETCVFAQCPFGALRIKQLTHIYIYIYIYIPYIFHAIPYIFLP